MRRTVRIAAGVVAAVAVTAFAISCGNSTATKLPTYTATLVGTSEVPSNTGTGTGTATFVDNGTSFDYTLTVNGLTAITASHIHAPAAVGVNAGIIINLFNPIGPPYGAVDGVIATGTITNANNQGYTVDALRALFIAGTAYVNVHTSALPGGSIRGQVARSN
jgi:hypothetical protein